MLAYPDFNRPLTIHTDASQKGLGAVLYQNQSWKMRVIGYGSHTLTPAEQIYHLQSGKLEFLGLKWAVCDKFRDYLFYAPHFTVFTDNNPLTCILSSAKLHAVATFISNTGQAKPTSMPTLYHAAPGHRHLHG